jgi:leucyl/phenylalanyl-tRNA--protein transferase
MHHVLAPEMLLSAYAQGLFPMADARGRIHWYSADPRAIIEPEGFHVPRTLRQRYRQRRFDVRVNTAFRQVMEACRQRPEGTWISPGMVEAYERLFRLGFAHSVEAWQAEKLMGGLYGVTLGAAFFGESMFHRATDASKVAVVALVERMVDRGYELLDVQVMTAHLARFGAVNVPRDEYLHRLAAALSRPCRFAD